MTVKKHRKFWETVSEQTDLPGETPAGVPIAELAGNSRVLIEGHKGILQYSREEIQVHMGYGSLGVTGENLELAEMSREQLVITGKIRGIQIGE